MLKIGLTGNIASGKSEFEKILKTLGFLVVDLDEVSHKLLEEDEQVKKAVLEQFNTLERAELAKVVFKDELKRKNLEKIIHPLLKKFIIELFEQNSLLDVAFVSGALLYEAGFDSLFDKIVFIDAPFNLRLARLMKRNKLDKDTALSRLLAQGDNKLKADFVIENTNSLDALKQKALEFINSLR